MPVLSKTVTYEEWLTTPEVSDQIEEVVDGEIVITPPPKWKHARTAQRLSSLLGHGLEGTGFLVINSEFGLIIRKSPLTSRVPDLAVFRESSIVEQDGYIHSPPELAIEILSPANTRAERAPKIMDYESIGVAEVWVLSPEARTIEVLRLASGKLVRTALLIGGTLAPHFAPGCSLEISSIWPE